MTARSNFLPVASSPSSRAMSMKRFDCSGSWDWALRLLIDYLSTSGTKIIFPSAIRRTVKCIFTPSGIGTQGQLKPTIISRRRLNGSYGGIRIGPDRRPPQSLVAESPRSSLAIEPLPVVTCPLASSIVLEPNVNSATEEFEITQLTDTLSKCSGPVLCIRNNIDAGSCSSINTSGSIDSLGR